MLSADYRHKYKTEFENHPLLGKDTVNPSKPPSVHDGNNANERTKDTMESLEAHEKDKDWSMEEFALNSSLCSMEIMLGGTGKSLSDFGLPLPNMDKEQYLQNCLQDHYIADEDDFLPEKAETFLKQIIQNWMKIKKWYLTTYQDS